jgi:hypothetical protein
MTVGEPAAAVKKRQQAGAKSHLHGTGIARTRSVVEEIASKFDFVAKRTTGVVAYIIAHQVRNAITTIAGAVPTRAIPLMRA